MSQLALAAVPKGYRDVIGKWMLHLVKLAVLDPTQVQLGFATRKLTTINTFLHACIHLKVGFWCMRVCRCNFRCKFKL